ncbi:hypothetical protein C4573_04415 [Candidatus Woesearchaeota archaeon]|nr:MAG: hypothetical protein C4573_04415 [Candidatus Woesearchaeota archaeon]
MIYVSLKYTRTVDVIINIINRMVDAYHFLFLCLLKKALDENKISEIPSTPKEQGALVKKLYEDKDIQEHVDLYFLLRQLLKAEYKSENEYRRHVTMVTYINGKREIVNIDIISMYYENQLKFYEKIKAMVPHE